MLNMFFVFFFQAEDGIRDPLVTGVQTCALPIWRRPDRRDVPRDRADGALQGEDGPLFGQCDYHRHRRTGGGHGATGLRWTRSEERRVGKECRSRWSPDN